MIPHFLSRILPCLGYKLTNLIPTDFTTAVLVKFIKRWCILALGTITVDMDTIVP
jgi:hypothetical protein